MNRRKRIKMRRRMDFAAGVLATIAVLCALLIPLLFFMAKDTLVCILSLLVFVLAIISSILWDYKFKKPIDMDSEI